jgi:hypothetical protein
MGFFKRFSSRIWYCIFCFSYHIMNLFITELNVTDISSVYHIEICFLFLRWMLCHPCFYSDLMCSFTFLYFSAKICWMQTRSWVLHSWLSSSQYIYREYPEIWEGVWEEVEQNYYKRWWVVPGILEEGHILGKVIQETV